MQSISSKPTGQNRTIGAGGEAVTTLEEIPRKMQGFEEFCQMMRDVICQGTDKYAGREKDGAETIDVLPMILGEEGYRLGILFDLIKRIFRLKNQNRERDVIKMGVWLYLYWQRFFRKEHHAKATDPRPTQCD